MEFPTIGRMLIGFTCSIVASLFSLLVSILLITVGLPMIPFIAIPALIAVGGLVLFVLIALFPKVIHYYS